VVKSAFVGLVIGLVLLVDHSAGALPVPCGDSGPQCDGACPTFEICVPVVEGATTSGDGPSCVCVPDFESFEYCGDAPQCGGECIQGYDCLPASQIFPQNANADLQGPMGGEPCFCYFENFCGVAPECGGKCPPGFLCGVPVVEGATSGAEDGQSAVTQAPPPVDICTCRPDPGATREAPALGERGLAICVLLLLATGLWRAASRRRS